MMKRLLLTGIAALFLATGAAHACEERKARPANAPRAPTNTIRLEIRLGMRRTLPASRAARRVSPPPHRPRVSRRHSSVRPDTDLLKLSRVLINRGALMSAMPLIAARKRTSPEVRVVPEAALSSKAFASVC